MIRSFDPIADENSKLLILGTMPGAESLRKQQYYGYDRNQFWKIMFSIFREDFKENYDEKKKLLLKNGAALWDVLKNCERESSSDSKIKNPEVNDISSLLIKYPGIKSIYFNGKMAETLFRKSVINKIDFKNLKLCILPSTSPANTVKFEVKLEEWKKILVSL